MRYIILFLLIPFFGFSQGGTWPVKYNDSDPSGAPSAAGTRLYFNTATNTLWFWEPKPSSQWRKQPKAFDQISGCAAPAYTPTARQSNFAVNTCTVGQNGHGPELYQYTGSAWECLNCSTGTNISAGSGITLSGTVPDITISADDVSPTNELQTLSIDGSDLSLSGGGGTVTIPGDGNGIYGGSGEVPDSTVAVLDGEFNFNINGVIDYSWGKNNAITAFDDFTGYVVDASTFSGLGIYNDNRGVVYPMLQNYFSYGDKATSFEQRPIGIIFSTTNTGTGEGATFSALNGGMVFSSFNGTDAVNLVFTATSAIFVDTRVSVNKVGIEYAAYYPDIETSPQSFTDVQTVQSIIGKKAFNGNYTSTGTATTAFTVTLPTTQPDATYSVSIMPKNALSATGWYISARTTTGFTVTYLTGLTGAVDFDYIVIN